MKLSDYEIRQINNAHEVVAEYFEKDVKLIAAFMRLLYLAYSINSNTCVRYNGDIIGASTPNSYYFFYISILEEKHYIKFKHLEKTEFEPNNMAVFEDCCTDAIEYVLANDMFYLDKSDKVKNRNNNDEHVAALIKLLKTEYGFNGFYHYTDYQNFRSIIQSGYLSSRNEAPKNFSDAADWEALTRSPEWIHDQVRLFYFPKTPFLYRNEGIKPKGTSPHMPRPVALVFDEKIAYIDGVKYLDGSAINITEEERHQTQITKDAKDALGFNWNLITYRGHIPKSWNNIIEVFGERDGAKITNCNNAEMILPGRLSLNYLKEIAFRSAADYKQAIAQFGKNPLFTIDDSVFNNNHSYLKDYEINWNKNTGCIRVELLYWIKDKLELFRHTLRIYKDDFILKEESFFNNDAEIVLEFANYKEANKIEYYIDDVMCASWEA